MRAPRFAVFGGRYLVREGDPRALEGDRSPRCTVGPEFDSLGQVEAFYRSAQCRETLAIRQRFFPLAAISSF